MLPMIILSASFLLSSTIMMIISPLHMGVIILMLALLLTTSIALTISSWLSFLVFLIYISGMLVLFSYFVALSPNQEYKSSTMNAMLILFISGSLIMTTTNSHQVPMIKSFMMSSMYTQSSSSILIILALALLVAMIIVVKLVTLTKGPLRPFNYV